MSIGIPAGDDRGQREINSLLTTLGIQAVVMALAMMQKIEPASAAELTSNELTSFHPYPNNQNTPTLGHNIQASSKHT